MPLPSLKDIRVLDLKDPAAIYALMEFVSQIAHKTQSLQDWIHFPPDVAEDMYGVASFFYNTKNFLEAFKLFEELVQLQTTNYKYALGAAASLHGLKVWPLAIIYYSLATFNKPEDPTPSFHAGECCVQYGAKDMAKNFLNQAITQAGSKKEFGEMKEKAALLLKGLP